MTTKAYDRRCPCFLPQGGSGFVRGINFFTVENPIRIDQNYCDQKGGAVCDPDDVRQRQQSFVDLVIRRTTGNCVYVHACMHAAIGGGSEQRYVQRLIGGGLRRSRATWPSDWDAARAYPVDRSWSTMWRSDRRTERAKRRRSARMAREPNCPTRTPPIDCLTPEDDDLIASAQQQPPPTLFRSASGTRCVYVADVYLVYIGRFSL